MHSCLTIPEIQLQIFSNISTDYKHLLPTLHSLTTTCKAFSSHALKLIWTAEQDLDLGNLVRTLPEDLCEENNNGILKFSRPLRVTDFDRFDYYASMIGTLHIRQQTLASRRHRDLLRDKWIRLDDAVFQAFEDYANNNRRSCFLPSLRTVTLSLCEGETYALETLPRLRYFLSSGVKSLVITHDLDYIVSDEALVNLVNLVTRSTPNIISLRQDVRRLGDRHWFELLQLPNIENLSGSIQGLRSPTIRRIGGMRSLRSLRCIYLDQLDLRGFTTEFGLFPSLTTLQLMDSTKGWETVVTLLANLHCPFKTLDILLQSSAATRPFSGSLTPAFTYLSESLTSLTITLWIKVNLYGDLPPTILRSLLDLRALQHLAIWIQDSDELTNDWLAEAAESWPDLQTLSILPVYGDISLRGMIPIIENCRKLETLRMYFPTIPFEPTLLLTTSNLNVRGSISLFKDGPQEMDPNALFKCITGMFPNVTGVKGVNNSHGNYLGSDEFEYRIQWGELEKLFRERRLK